MKGEFGVGDEMDLIRDTEQLFLRKQQQQGHKNIRFLNIEKPLKPEKVKPLSN